MKRIIKKTLAVVIALTVLFGTVSSNAFTKFQTVSAAQIGYVNSSYVNIRTAPNTSSDANIIRGSSGAPIYLDPGTTINIVQKSGEWYKISFSYESRTITGYMYGAYVDVQSEVVDINPSSDFEQSLSQQGFPESYKPYLRVLHAAYPNWVFKANKTNINWNTLVANEIATNGYPKNLIQGPAYDPHFNWRSQTVGYYPLSNSWTVYDGSDWYAASDDIVKYYLDPRNYLNVSGIFAFESLSYQKDSQNVGTVDAILQGSFMYKTKAKNDSRTYAQLIMNAAAKTGVSPYHLASRIKQEMGNSPNPCALGTSSSVPGIFNLYNIGANDSSSGDAAIAGLRWARTSGAYGRPWTSAEKSITGGAMFIGEDYINVGQDTLYSQKFNISTYSRFSHQYMTNVQAPMSEAASIRSAYSSKGLLNQSYVFKIPVYDNMPSVAVVKPADTGNPNNYLKSLTVSGYNLSPAFNYKTMTYNITVPGNVTSVNIGAQAVVYTSKVTGTGNVSLKNGTNTIRVQVKAQTGSVRIYTINITKKENLNGLLLINGKWYNYVNNKRVGNTVAQNQYGWWYINSQGTVDFKYNGVASNSCGTWYIGNGKVDFSKNGLLLRGKWYNFKGGKVVKEVTVAQNQYGWWYIDSQGTVDFTYTGKYKDKNGIVWNVVKGRASR